MNLPTILYAENDPVALTMYQKRLEREGYRLETAQDGIQALEKITRHVPDLLLLDLVLPTMSGADVLRFLQADPSLSHLPVVIFSNAPKTEVPEEITLEDPIRFLSKADCSFPTLLENIQQLLKSAAAGDTAPVAVAATQPAIAAQPAATAPPVTIAQPATKVPVATKTPPASQPPALPPQAGLIGSKGARKESHGKDFLNQPSAEIESIRQHCFGYVKSPQSPVGKEHLARLRQCVDSLETRAGEVGNGRVAFLTKSFNALLADLAAQTSRPRPSALQTVAQAVDCLDQLLEDGKVPAKQPMPRGKVLSVDDDPVCNQVMTLILKRAGFDGECVQNPVTALEMLRAKRYDIILLDIDMPQMTGFQLCEKFRRLSHCKTVPVIFITAHNNFDNRKQSVLVGAHDFISKPVVAAELTLQISLHLLKAQEQSGDAPAEPEPSAPSVAASAAAGQPDSLGSQATTVAASGASEAKSTSPKPLAEAKARVEAETASPVPLRMVEPTSAPAPDAAPSAVASLQPSQVGKDEQPGTVPLRMAALAPEPTPHPDAAPAAKSADSTSSRESLPAETNLGAPKRAFETASEPAAGKTKTLPPSATISPATEPAAQLAASAPAPEPPQPVAPPAVEPAPVQACAPASEPQPPQAVAVPVAEAAPAELSTPPAMSEELAPAGPPEATLSHTAPIEFTPSTNKDTMQKGQNPAFDKIVTEVARIMFGDENVTELNLRLVRMALESAKVHELVGTPPASK